MIDFLRGHIAHLEHEYIVLDVQGVGYRIFCPNPYAFAKTEEAVKVYIHYHVREDAILLFGFSGREEQQLFRKLIEVSGIGPKVALGILGGGAPAHVIAAIHQENVAFLTKLPGIGKKTAQRMILDLKDKLEGIGSIAAATGLLTAPSVVQQEEGTSWSEAREALQALGYTDTELDKAWVKLKQDISSDDSVDILMKRALQVLFAG